MDTCTRYVKTHPDVLRCGAPATRWFMRNGLPFVAVIPRCEAHFKGYVSVRFEPMTREEAEVITVMNQ
jgi:hypothetical protein